MSRVAVVHLARQSDEFAKGVGWFPRRYEPRFDEVDVVCLYGAGEPASKGKTSYRSFGSGSWRADLALAPFRLLRAMNRRQPDAIVGYDPFFLWWATLLVRIRHRVPVLLVAMCLPEEIRQQTGRSVSGLPAAIERWLIRCNFAGSRHILVPENAHSWSRWVNSYRSGRRRLKVIRPSIVEGYLSLEFYERLEDLSGTPVGRTPGSLLYVGRLHTEKHVLDLIDVLARAADATANASLTVVGDGPLKEDLLAGAEAAGVSARLVMHDRLDNEKLAELYRATEVFVSPYTAMSAREAALAGCAIAGYDTVGLEFLRGAAKLAPLGDVEALAAAAAELLTDAQERAEVEARCTAAAHRLWGRGGLESALEATFDFLDAASP